MRLEGRSISRGVASGEAILLEESFSFLGGVDTGTGDLRPDGGNIRGKVFLFPRGRGSTVGSYTIYDLKVKGNLPAAIVNESAETIVSTGAVMASVPMVDGVDISLVRTGDTVTVDGDAGTVDIEDVEERTIATAVLVHEGKVLMLKRSGRVGTFKGQWACVSGHVEDGETPLEAALRETSEEVSIELGSPVAQCRLDVRDGDIVFRVYAYMFESGTSDVTLDWEHDEHRWMDVDGLRALRTVPGLVRTIDALDAQAGILR